MNISHNWLRDHIELGEEPAEIARILTLLGFEVESVSVPGEVFRRFVTGRVASKEKHPKADKLSVCTVEVGEEVPRTIVCGAPNVEAGQYVVVALDGALVPAAGFVIERRMLRGVESNGMICGKSELCLGEEDGGIWVLDDTPAPGTALSSYLYDDDAVYDISVTPNRPDVLSHRGIARELSAWFSRPLKSVSVPAAPVAEVSAPSVSVSIDAPQLCGRYIARVIRGVRTQPSPDHIQRRLRTVGVRPRSLAVDVTNYVMFDCGQPLHAFDLRAVRGGRVVVRAAAEEESIVTLDGKQRTLASWMPVIADGERALAVAGVMGGKDSEIGDATEDILLESAWFVPSSVRKASKALALQSDSSYRFERGVDPELAEYASAFAAGLIASLGGGAVESACAEVRIAAPGTSSVEVRYARIAAIVGVDIQPEEVRDILGRLGFAEESATATSVTVRVPSYRVDIREEIDLIEEVARLRGYDAIPVAATSRVGIGGGGVPAPLAPNRLEAPLGALLRGLGYDEVMTPNQTDAKTVEASGIAGVVLANPLGEEMSRMRTSLVPSLVKVAGHNIRHGNKKLAIYEIGTVFSTVAPGAVKTFVAGIQERRQLSVLLSGPFRAAHWSEKERASDFYDIKGVAEAILASVGAPSGRLALASAEQPEPYFGADVLSIALDGVRIGACGAVAAEVRERYEAEQDVFALWLDLTAVAELPSTQPSFAPFSAFPAVARDFAFVLDESVPARDVRRAIEGAAGSYCKSIEIFDIFKHESLGKGKQSMAWSVVFQAMDRTLTEADINPVTEAIVRSVADSTGGVLRGPVQ